MNRIHAVHMKNLLTENEWPGGVSQKFKHSQDLIVCGQKFGPVCQKQLSERTSSNDQSRNRSSTKRKLRDINFNDLDDKEFEKKREEKLPMEAAMPCELKTFQHRETCGESNEIRESKHARIVEAPESTRKRSE